MPRLNEVTRASAPPLPATRTSLLAHRVVEMKRTLNDLVEEACVELWDNHSFQGFLVAVWDEQAVEGSLAADNVEAARMIREHVRGSNSASVLASAKLASIIKAMNVVLRRYEISRKERRNMVGGEVVSNDNNGD